MGMKRILAALLLLTLAAPALFVTASAQSVGDKAQL